MSFRSSGQHEKEEDVKRATVYRRQGKYFVHALSSTTDGIWILCEPIFALLEGEESATLGRRVAAALDGSHENVPPRSWKGLLTPLLALSGVRSWTAFSRSATCVDIDEEGGRVALVPMISLGPKEGFRHDTANQIFTTRDDLARLGSLIAETLDKAK